jgi:hypothetical protein
VLAFGQSDLSYIPIHTTKLIKCNKKLERIIFHHSYIKTLAAFIIQKLMDTHNYKLVLYSPLIINLLVAKTAILELGGTFTMGFGKEKKK